MSSQKRIEAALNGFLLAYLEDWSSGRTRSLEEYQECFPGFEGPIERELRLLSTAPEEEAYRSIGPYRIVRELGRGGQGKVYLAQDSRLPRRVALKVLSSSASLSKAARLRFVREAELASKLDHPALCTVYEAGDEDGLLYIAMRYLEGTGLARWIASKHTVELDRAAEIISEIARAVHEAHRVGIVHRDIKPGNIVLTEPGSNGSGLQPVLLDFGTARDVDSRTLTISGEVFGTPAYMAPEQVEGRAHVLDPRVDVYALGVTLYECATLRLPFEAESRETLYRQILDRDPPDPRRIVSGFPRDLTAILEKCLEKSPERRYPTALELAEDLDRFRRGEPVRAKPITTSARLARKVRRHPIQASLVSSLALLVLTASSLYLSRDSITQAHERERMNVVRLSAFQRLEDLTREADELWPAAPRLLERYDDWLNRSEELVAGLEAAPDGSDIGHRAQLARLRQRALSRPAAEIEAERRAHPRFDELEQMRARLGALRRAQDVREGRRSPVEVELDLGHVPGTDRGLDFLSFELAGPRRYWFGGEARGLAVARHAVERAEGPSAKAIALNNLAWALFANGLDEEALEQSRTALQVAANDDHYVRENRDLAAAVAEARSEEQAEILPGWEQKLRDLEAEVHENRRWVFEDDEDQWWHDQLTKLVADIEAFADPEAGLISGISDAHGWGVERRLAHASMLAENELRESAVARLWDEAIASIADPGESAAYRGLVLKPQTGLVPLGMDPDSGLWEFAELATGEPAERNTDGGLVIVEESGLVFVLLPGGTSRMGAQAEDSDEPHYYSEAESDEGPVHEVTLTPFFLSKFELTQGQWLRFNAANPSVWGVHRWLPESGIDPANLMHPLESASWNDCAVVLERLGFRFPTEAEWEYAARAGTGTPWFTGDEPEKLADVANLWDAFARDNRTTGSEAGEAWNDGFRAHAPVGKFGPNPFGLHDVAGNVREWCLDGYVNEYIRVVLEQSMEDPFFPPFRAEQRITRGGAYDASAVAARSSVRTINHCALGSETIGLRPARSIEGAVRWSVVPKVK